MWLMRALFQCFTMPVRHTLSQHELHVHVQMDSVIWTEECSSDKVVDRKQ